MNPLNLFTKWKYRVDPVRTAIFNFRKFDFKTAVKFPVLIGRHTILRCLDGDVNLLTNINKSGGVKRIRIGFRDMGIQDESKRKTILDLRKNSCLTFEGSASIGGGSRIYTKGKLIIGDNFYLSLNSQLIAHNYIKFGKDCTVGWDSLIMDTDFHEVYDVDTQKPYPMTKPIIIGKHCWICNNVQILKGTVIPDEIIVGSCSLLNKDYDIPSFSLLAGNPAKLRKTGISHNR